MFLSILVTSGVLAALVLFQWARNLALLTLAFVIGYMMLVQG